MFGIPNEERREVWCQDGEGRECLGPGTKREGRRVCLDPNAKRNERVKCSELRGKVYDLETEAERMNGVLENKDGEGRKN